MKPPIAGPKQFPGRTTISQSDAARIKGVTMPAITRAVKEGRLVLTADRRIDPEIPKNREFLGRDPWQRPGSDGKSRPGQSTDKASGKNHRLDARLRAFTSRAEVELQKKRLECERLEIQNATARRELAPVLTTTRALADLGEVMRVQFLYLPRRLAARLLAAVQGGADVHAVEALLVAELAGGIAKFKDAAARSFEEHLAEIIEQGEGDADEEA